VLTLVDTVMNEPNNSNIAEHTGRLLGVVQVRVAGRLYALPVEAMDFASDKSDTATQRGGFFVEGDSMGILVDEAVSEQQMRSQVMDGCAEAVRHLSAKILN
jgi:hypothetical protein